MPPLQNLGFPDPRLRPQTQGGLRPPPSSGPVSSVPQFGPPAQQQQGPGFFGSGGTLMEILQNPMLQQLLMGSNAQGGQGGPQAAGIQMPNLQGLLQPYMPNPVTPVSFGGGLFG
jgi:hypothetical protein